MEVLLRRGHRNSPPFIGHAISSGWGRLVGELAEPRRQASRRIEQVRSAPNRIMGWLPPELRANTILARISKVWWNGQRYVGTEPTDGLPAGYLWVCGHYGRPLPADRTSCCTWGRPYLAGRILPMLPKLPRSWDPIYRCWHWQKRAACEIHRRRTAGRSSSPAHRTGMEYYTSGCNPSNG